MKGYHPTKQIIPGLLPIPDESFARFGWSHSGYERPMKANDSSPYNPGKTMLFHNLLQYSTDGINDAVSGPDIGLDDVGHSYPGHPQW